MRHTYGVMNEGCAVRLKVMRQRFEC